MLSDILDREYRARPNPPAPEARRTAPSDARRPQARGNQITTTGELSPAERLARAAVAVAQTPMPAPSLLRNGGGGDAAQQWRRKHAEHRYQRAVAEAERGWYQHCDRQRVALALWTLEQEGIPVPAQVALHKS